MTARVDTQAAKGLAEQTLDDGYPFPREHKWWADQAERHARDVLALVGLLADAEKALRWMADYNLTGTERTLHIDMQAKAREWCAAFDAAGGAGT